MNKGLVLPRESSQKIFLRVGTKEKKVQSRALGIVEYYKRHTPYTFGQALKICMDQTHISVAELSARTGISDRQIGRIRNDEVKEISFRTIVAVCIAMNLVLETSEVLLKLKRYTMHCDESYVQLCKMFLQVNVTVGDCNKMLKNLGYEPLTDGEIW